MEKRLVQLADLVGGQLYGAPDTVVRDANPPQVSEPDHITLIVDLENHKHAIRAAAVVTPEYVETCSTPQLVVAEPHTAFAEIVSTFRPPRRESLPGVGMDSSVSVANSAKVHPTATVCEDVRIGERTLIMPGVVLMPGCVVGDDCVLHPNVTLYENTMIRDRVRIHAGSVLGAHGFGYKQVDGRHVLSSQLGYVEIESDVDIGAGVTIDRGTYGATKIGEGTKIDNQVMIAHNCRIGRYNLICSQVGIAGSCTTGDYVILAGQVGLKDHIHLGDHTIVGAKAGVMDDCEGGQVYLGAPAMVQRDQMQIFALQRKLPDMRRELKTLRKQVAELSRSLDRQDTDEDRRAA
ncbi:MAG: UDP-3-O-(3-hydroxymyristoyl)glucosamine N-acyltransferase [Planctomycetota bacterium]